MTTHVHRKDGFDFERIVVTSWAQILQVQASKSGHRLCSGNAVHCITGTELRALVSNKGYQGILGHFEPPLFELGRIGLAGWTDGSKHLPQRGVHIAEARAHDVQEGLLRRLVHVREHEPSVRRREQSPGRGRERGRESAWSRRRSSAQANTCARTQQTCLCSAESASEHSPVLHPYFRVTTFFFRSAHVHTLGVLPCRSTALRVPRPTSCILAQAQLQATP